MFIVLSKRPCQENEPPNGCAKCSNKTSLRWHKNEDTKEMDICSSCYQKDLSKKNEPPNGCAKCSKRTSSVWNKNKDTKEMDICTTCYKKDLAKKNEPPIDF